MAGTVRVGVAVGEGLPVGGRALAAEVLPLSSTERIAITASRMAAAAIPEASSRRERRPAGGGG